MQIRMILGVAIAALIFAAPLTTETQTADDAGAKNAQQARAALDAMVQALGGQAWLQMKSQLREGRSAAFFHGKPSGSTVEYYEYHVWPDHDRIEFTKHRDVVQFYVGREGWEVTYRGKDRLPQELVDDYMRRRDHSIETVIKVWLNDPRTILIYEGQRMAERHLAEQVSLISAQNESVTIQMDIQTHLPLRRTFEWRDPVYHDKNLDVEEYADYHVVDGFPTAFNISRYKNDDEIRQLFLYRASYNIDIASDFWSVDAAERRIKK
jgi:hypothetical protein